MSHANPFGQGARTSADGVGWKRSGAEGDRIKRAVRAKKTKPPAKPRTVGTVAPPAKLPAKKESTPDWEAIEREYRAGQLSIRQIARQHGVHEATMRKRAQKQGWARDLTRAVRHEVEEALVRSAHPAYLTAPDEAIITFAADRGVEIVRQHREHLGRLQRIATRLAQQLEVMLGGGEPDAPFLGLKESPSDALAKISQATARWMPLERQAFGLDKRADDDDTPALVTIGIDWRMLFEQAGISHPDGGAGEPTPRRELPPGVTALPIDR